MLETEHLGFPATTRSGALALRALLQDGYRPVFATGRSAVDVADRCADYGLPGGVAEYGGAIVVAAALAASSPTTRRRRSTGCATCSTGVDLDPLYRYSVRARGLDEAAIACVTAAGDVYAVRGEGQTDFVPTGIHKGLGVTALLAELGAGQLALAVGDTASDLPLLALAGHAAAPGHAGWALRHVRVRRPYQAGLAEAVEAFLGRSCDVRLEPRTELLMAILSAQERGHARDALRRPAGSAGAVMSAIAGAPRARRLRERLDARTCASRCSGTATRSSRAG